MKKLLLASLAVLLLLSCAKSFPSGLIYPEVPAWDLETRPEDPHWSSDPNEECGR